MPDNYPGTDIAKDSKISVLGSLKQAGLFLPSEKMADIAAQCKLLTQEDKDWLIGRMLIECPQMIKRSE